MCCSESCIVRTVADPQKKGKSAPRSSLLGRPYCIVLYYRVLTGQNIKTRALTFIVVLSNYKQTVEMVNGKDYLPMKY